MPVVDAQIRNAKAIQHHRGHGQCAQRSFDIEGGAPCYFKLLQARLWDEPSLKKRIESSGHTPESLLEHSMSSVQDDIQKLDQLIALRVKTLMQLQQSYEALVNRSVLQERLKLQNDLLRRDLQAIDLPVVESTSPADDKRQAKSLK